jgi:hypothetical protein
LKKVKTSVAFSLKEDETASAYYYCSRSSSLFRILGFDVTKGTYSLVQPTIRPLFNTKQFQECFVVLEWK